MERAILWTMLMNFSGWLAFGQSPELPARFEIADVHSSAKTPNLFVRSGPLRGGRFEVKNANMVDLVRLAYGVSSDKVLSGPSWLEIDRFDVIAKLPADTPQERRQMMLQSLLADRFQLVVHKETKPLPTYALTVGKKPQIKEAAGTEEPGCRPETVSGPPKDNAIRIMTGGPNGVVSIDLGPGATIHYMCRNMTMAAFAAGLREMGAEVGPNQVLDETGLKGNWNFDVRFTYIRGPMAGETGERVSIFTAVEKQLGLKLEERQIPTPVIVVDSVNEKPTANPPGVAEALAAPRPTEFEVASIKPSRSDERGGRFGMQPGGRFNAENVVLSTLIDRAFNTGNTFNRDKVTGLPDWANVERFDIVATAPSAGPGAAIDNEALMPMLRALLADRFKMTFHTEERPVSAYSLVSAKPKMRKADPSSRTSCKNMPAAPNAGPGSQLFICQNITMPQFADRLQNMSMELSWPVLDATGIEGGWDFSLTYTRNPGMQRGRGGEAKAGEGGTVPMASEPSGAVNIFEAIEKQLGLRLELHKRPMPVIVIDHLEQRPTDN